MRFKRQTSDFFDPPELGTGSFSVREDPIKMIDRQLEEALNGGLTLADNLRGASLEVTTTTGVQKVNHGLGFVPSGFIVIFRSGEVSTWGVKEADWTTEELFLQSSVPNLKVRLFVM